MGYVAQEHLEVVEDDTTEDFMKIRHPFLLSLFLGVNNQGHYIPCL